MKTVTSSLLKHRRLASKRGVPLICAASIALFSATQALNAANATWSASPTDANWSLAGNWVGGVPGATNAATANVVNADTATFNAALFGTIGGVSNPIVIDANRIIKGITFDTAAVGAFVIGSNAGNALAISHTGAININAAVVNSQVIAAPIVIRLPSSTT